MKITSTLILLFLAFIGKAQHYKEVTLSSVSIEVPRIVTSGNITSISNLGFSTYSFNRLANDSVAYKYNYSFRYGNAMFEFRETSKADIWEWLENTYRPKRKRKSEFKHYKIGHFRDIENETLKGKFQQFQIEYIDGRRKLKLIYKLDESTQFMASVKSAKSPEVFMAAQDSLLTFLNSLQLNPLKKLEHKSFEQSEYIKDQANNHLVELPFALSNDFDNPVVATTPDNKLIVAFAHADGTEILFFNENFKLKSHITYGRLIHAIKATEDGFFAVSSDDYNLLTYGIYPSIYLTKHDKKGELIFTESFFKKDNVKVPGNKVFDYYSRDNVCLEIADSVGIVYTTSEERTGLKDVVQKGAYRTFHVDDGFLKKGKQDFWHVSHCFAQKSLVHEEHAYLYSLGDYDPRGLTLSKINLTMHKDSTDSTSFFHEVLLPISGLDGDNYIADSHISAPIVWKNNLYIAVETEEDAKSNHDDNPYSVNRGMNDIFIVKCDLDAYEIKITQMTKTKFIEEVNPKLAVVGDRLLLIYNEVQYNNTGAKSGIEDKFVFLNERLRREGKLDVLQTYYGNEPQSQCKMPDGPVNRDGNELVTMPNGNVIWVRLMRNTRQLEIVEIKG
ncbi:MAG: hypothetical protein MK078_14915 [Crocinitomicaceae bacterium]|nr:hypothetical protein [Crocinitomicaceae bacterium]